MFKVGDRLIYNNRGKNTNNHYIVFEVGKDYFMAGPDPVNPHIVGKYHLDGSGYYGKLGDPSNVPLVRKWTPLDELL